MMRIVVNKTIVTRRLGRELTAAGIVHHGMSLFGDVLEILLVNENQAEQVPALIEAHDGVDTFTERFEGAEGKASNIPGWATWSEADALEWWSSNLSDAQVDAIANLADAKAMLKKQNAGIRAMARLLVALRDRVFPGLPE